MTSENGGQFSKADATFAIKHVDADDKAEAVEAAESYLEALPMSRAALVSLPSPASRRPPTRTGCPRRGRNPAVLGRAARWFVEQGRIKEAVRHLQLSGNEAAAAELLAAHQVWSSSTKAGAAALHAERLGQKPRFPPQLALPLSCAAKISGLSRAGRPLDRGRRTPDRREQGARRLAEPSAAALMMRGINGTPAADPAQAVALC